MTNLMLRILGPIALVLCLWSAAGIAARAPRLDVPMNADRWQTMFGKPEFKEHKGVQALVFTAEGVAKLGDFVFRNGTIQFDVEPAAMGAGLGLRMADLGPGYDWWNSVGVGWCEPYLARSGC